MTNVTDFPRARAPRGRIALVPIIAGLFVLWFVLQAVSRLFTDYLFFSELSFTRVFRAVAGTQITLVLVFGLIFFAIVWGNLVLADRFAPAYRPLGPGDELVARYREIVGTNANRLRTIIAVVLSLIAGFGASSQWENWLLFRHGGSFGRKDPLSGFLFGRDVGFYVFKLPFLQFLVGWTFTAVLIAAVLTTIAHYLNGGIRLAPSVLDRVTPQVRAHLSLLFAALALIKAAGYLVQRWTLLYSGKGVVQGATYTDLKARLPAINLLCLASITAAVLLIVNVRRRGWTLPGVSIGLWLALSILVGQIYPAIIQTVKVNPAENSKERPYIKRNIAATREALGISSVASQPFTYQDGLTADDLSANQDTIRNIRLWDPKFTTETYESLQSIKGYYAFHDVDSDRYVLDGRKTQALTSVRELYTPGLPDSGRAWVNRHLQYTHGYGAVLAPANAASPDGNPLFRVQDVPPVGDPKIDQPRVYFGEQLGDYAIVNTKQKELDASDTSSNYSGKGGVELSSFARRVAFALRFGEKNILLSGQITPKSRAIFYRDISARVKKAAPFLKFDSDPYPVILDGKITWILDAYTTSTHYPYAQNADSSRVPNDSGLVAPFNYVRNSVKATVDAFDGKVTFYRVDEKDPVAAAYAKAFPKLFTDGDKMPEGLVAHLRYPEDLFRVQTTMFGRYHLTNPDEFFSASEAWNVAPDPGTSDAAVSTNGNTSTVTAPLRKADDRMAPYYVLTRLPTDTEANFQILQPFVPRSSNDSRKNLTAFMVAKSDPGSYGKLEAYVMPAGQQVAGPTIIATEMGSNPAVAQAETLLSQSGSRIKRGNIVMLPIANSIVAVRPLYVQAEAASSFPQLRKVVVWHAGDVRIADTLQEALTALFGDAPPTQEQTGQNPSTPSTPTSASVSALLGQAEQEFQAADDALKNGDLAGYQSHIAKAHEYTQRAKEAADEQPQPASTTTTTRPASSA